MPGIDIKADPDEKTAEMLSRVMQLRGKVPNIYKTAAHSLAALNHGVNCLYFLSHGFKPMQSSKVGLVK